MIGLSGAFGNGGVCGDGVQRLCKCSSLIVDGDAATSSRSPSMDEADRFVGCIWAMVDGIGGVNVRARGDNSGVVGVLDMMLIQQFQLRLINVIDSISNFNTFTHMQRKLNSVLFICFCFDILLFRLLFKNSTLWNCCWFLLICT